MMGLDIYSKYLEGKTIKSISYLSRAEAQNAMWDKRPLVIRFTDGTYIIPMRDDEGNDGGSLYYGDKENGDDVIPTILLV